MSVINEPVCMPTKPYFICGEKRGSQLSNYLGSPTLSCSLGRTLRPVSPALEDVSPDLQLKSHHSEIRVHNTLSLYQVIMGEWLLIFFLLYSFCVEAWGELLSNLTNFWSTLAVESPRLWVAWTTQVDPSPLDIPWAPAWQMDSGGGDAAGGSSLGSPVRLES